MPSVVNHVIAFTTGAGSLTSPTFTATAGNVLIVLTSSKSNTSLTITTSGGDTETAIDNGNGTPASGAYKISYFQNITGGAGYSVSVTPGGGTPTLALQVIEVSGLIPSGSRDVLAAAPNTPATTTPSSGTSGSTSITNEIALSYIVSDSVLNPATLTVPAGYTLLDSQLNGNSMVQALAYKLLSSIQTLSATWTTDSTTSVVGVVSFEGVTLGSKVFRPKVINIANHPSFR